MPEWLTGGPPSPAALVPELVALRLIQASCLGFLVAAVYFATQRKKRNEVAPIVATLVLLTVLIAMVSQVIGESAARAFSLVGVLSIVRFRTVVDDTRDTAFVIFAVVVGMAAGTGYYDVAAVGLVVGGIAAFTVRTKIDTAWEETESGLTLRVGLGVDPK